MRYRKVSVQIWRDRDFRTLPDDAKLLFLCVLTHPDMTSIGAMRCTVTLLAEELRWPSERTAKALQDTTGKKMVRFDEDAQYIDLPNFLRHNSPSSPKVVIGWINSLDAIPECDLRDDMLKRTEAFLEAMENPNLIAAFHEGLERRLNGNVTPKTAKRQAKPDARFDAFFKVYPKQEGRGQAEKKWHEAMERGVNPDDLTAAAQHYTQKVEAEATETKFIKEAKNFLATDDWKDYLKPQVEELGKIKCAKCETVFIGDGTEPLCRNCRGSDPHAL